MTDEVDEITDHSALEARTSSPPARDVDAPDTPRRPLIQPDVAAIEDGDVDVEPRRRGVTVGEWRVIAFSFALTVLAAGLASITPDQADWGNPFGSGATFLVITVMFGVAEYFVFQVRFRREGSLFSFTEIPMAFAVVFLAPFVGLLSRFLLTSLVFAFRRGNRRHKLIFNVALILFELAAVGFMHHSLVAWWGDSAAAAVTAIAVSLMLITLLTPFVIAFAISIFEGRFAHPTVRELGATWWLYTVTSVLAAMTVALTLISPGLTMLALLPIVSTWYVLHSYGVLGQELRDLDAVHGFAGRIGDTLDVRAIGDVATDEAMRVFRADGAVLVRFGPSGAVVHTAGRVVGVDDQPDVIDHWRALTHAGDASIVGPARLDALGITAEPARPTMMVTPVNDGGELLAVLAVTRDDLPQARFDSGDRARLRNIAEQLSVSLRRGMLHERLEWEARHDALTGLPARTLFELRVTEATTRRVGMLAAVMMLDLDRFKEVNDTLGHHAGDALLIEFSRRIENVLGPGDYLARLAGDEFAILCRRATIDEIREVAQRCVEEGGRPVTLDGLEIVVTVSVGVAEVGKHDTEALQPMRRADIAMYNAKWQRSGVEFYRDEIDRRTPARLSMLGDLRAAIESSALNVVYQPKLDLVSGYVVGLEALVRWEHLTRGVVPPTEFVRVAEDTGLIKQLTDLVLSNGIGLLARLQKCGLAVGLAVNLSTHDLFDSRLPVRVRDYLDSNGVDPSLLTLEITESSLFVDAPRTRATIDDLYAVGLRMAVDDFGTGYSSLSYLRRLPVHELKIDQSFVAGMLTDEQDEVIVRSTVDLGHNLGLLVVAEGVESVAGIERLTEIGCDVAQGYAISKPLGEEEVVEWLHRSKQFGWRRPVD